MQDLTALLVKIGIKTFGFKITLPILLAAKETVARQKSATIFRLFQVHGSVHRYDNFE